MKHHGNARHIVACAPAVHVRASCPSTVFDIQNDTGIRPTLIKAVWQ